MGSKYTDGGGDWLLRGAVIAAIALVLGGLVVTYVLLEKREKAAPSAVPAQAAEGGLVPPPPVDFENFEFIQFAEYFCRAQGGRDFLENLNTMALEGQYSSERGEFDVFLVKRAPDHVSLRLERSGATLLIVGGHHGVYSRLTHQGQVISNEELTGSDAYEVRLQGRIYLPFMELCLYSKGVFEAYEATEYARRPAVLIRFTQDGTQHEAIVDAETYLIAEHRTFKPDRLVRIVMTDYQPVGPTWMPMKVVTYSGSRIVSSLEMSRIEVNPGTLPVLFERPSGEPGEML